MAEQKFTDEELHAKVEGCAKQYNEEGLWKLLTKSAKSIGEPVVLKALEMYYAMLRQDMPIADKVKVMGALAYLVMPLDLIPDFVPVLGWTDDAAALTYAYTQVSIYIDEQVQAEARKKLDEFFG